MKRFPEINVLPTYSVHLRVLDQEIEYTPFTVEQEKALITALEDNKTDDIIRNYETILKQCVKDDIDWNELSVVDYLTLVISVRSKSKGEALELTKKACDKCKQPFDFSVDVTETIEYDNTKTLSAMAKLSEELTVEVKPLGYKFLYGLGGIENEIDMYIHTAAHCISKIFYGKDIYRADPDVLRKKLIKNLRQSDLEKIFMEYSKLITLKMNVHIVCPHCGTEENIIVDDFLKSLK